MRYLWEHRNTKQACSYLPQSHTHMCTHIPQHMCAHMLILFLKSHDFCNLVFHVSMTKKKISKLYSSFCALYGSYSQEEIFLSCPSLCICLSQQLIDPLWVINQLVSSRKRGHQLLTLLRGVRRCRYQILSSWFIFHLISRFFCFGCQLTST